MADEVSLESKTLTHFLRNDIPNTAAEVVTFLKGIVAKAVSFFQGIVNRGDIKNIGDITNTGNINNAGDITNSGNIMTKNLTVTGKATFFELEIQKAKAAGGMTVNSAGTFHIDAVEETADGFVCFQRAEKDGVTLSRTCEVNDQMMCSDGMNILKGGKGNHYYWRLVTDAPKEVVTRTIDGKEEKCLKLVLSKTDCSNPTDDMPKVGDELAQIGNRKNKERQSVIMTCAYNSFDGDLKVPYWVQYMGVNDFKLATHKRTWFAANGSQVTGDFKVKGADGGLESAEDYMDRLVRENNSALYKLVENGTRPNLLWGSDLNLDGVDVSDKAAVEKRLGAGLVETRMDGGRFRYLKGEGVDGSDALMFRSEKGVARVVGLCFGVARELRVRPGSVCTMSAWVAFDSHGGQGSVFCDMESWNEAKGGFERVWSKPVKADHQYDSKDVARWTRCRWTFRVGGSGRVRFYLCAFTDKSQCDLWLCRPKLEEGDTATPWCAYDDMDARKGKDAVTYKLLPMTENALAYMDGEDKQKLVDLQLVYKIQKTVGERVSFTTLKAEGMTLTVEPSFGEAFADLGDIYDLGHSLSYDEKNPVSSYAVTLKKGDDIVDRRVVPVTFKPKVVFDIDTKNGEINSEISNVRGDMNRVERNLKQTSSAVGNLSEDFTRFKQTANEISLTVNSGARPNLLWGSDLNLDGVDVADKAAVSRRLGAGLVETRMDGGRFRYLKGEGVDGSDALMFRSEKGVARVVGLCFGVARELRVRPGSVCTMSAWVAFDSHGGQGSVFCDMESWNEAKGGFERVWSKPVKADHQYDSKDVARWTRCRWTFRVGGSGRVRFYLCAFTDKSMCDLWLCRPKLEEGDKATPWREYDRTADLERAILDIKSGEITLDARKTTVKGDLTAKSLRTEGDPAKGGATIVAKGGMFTVYGVNKSVPGIEIGLNEAGEPVLRMYKNGKFAYDLGPDTIFEQVAETRSSFTPCDLRRICAPDGQGMEKAFGPSFPDNYRAVRAYVFSEGYRKVGGPTMYKVSGTDEPSEYNGAHFAERRDTPDVTAEELEKLRRIADGWYLDGGSHGGPGRGGPGRVDEPSGDGSDGQGNEMRRFVVRLYANGEATPRTGSFTVSGDGQRGWTVSKVDIPFQGRP